MRAARTPSGRASRCHHRYPRAGARGIDSAAHRGAIAQPGGRTIAVLGSGVDVAYPPENEALFRQVAAAGVVMSEYPMGSPPAAENFPRRNRIISGLSRGVIVIEADERSGALITARQACDEHGRPVFAVPGRVDNPLSQGPHKLIRDGAFLCARLEDVLDNLGPLPAEAHEAGLYAPPPEAPREGGSDGATADLFGTAKTSPSAPKPSPPKTHPELPDLPDRQQAVVDAMDDRPATVDDLVTRTGFPAHVVLQELTFLSLRGWVKRVDGQTYVRAR